MPKAKNGYYDPGLEAVIPAAVPVAREAYAGARRVGGRVWMAQRRFARSQNVALGLKLALVAGLWAVGMYVLYVFASSGAKKIVEKYALPAATTMIFPGIGMLWYAVIGLQDLGKTIGDWINPPKEKKAPDDVTSDATKEVVNYLSELKSYIIVWSIFCVLIAVYVYYQHRQEQAMYV